MKHSLLTTLLLLLVSIAASAYDFAVDGIYYNINDGDSTVSVTYGDSWIDGEHLVHVIGLYSGDVTVPQQVDYQEKTYVVTEVGNNAFAECDGLRSVVIPGTVTLIGTFAFSNSSVQSVSIPNSVTEIGSGAFTQCPALRCITLPERLTKISDGLFEFSGLAGIDIPDSVTYIGGGAFLGTNLTSIYIPASVSTIGFWAINGCKHLERIQVSEDNPYYDSHGDCNAIIRTSSNFVKTACDNTVIPDDVVGFADYAFDNCGKIRRVVIPASVTKIGSYVFTHCSNLAEVFCKATTPPQISKFSFTFENTTLYVPSEALETYRNADYWKDFSKILPIGYPGSGDVNGDCVVNISDVNYVINVILAGRYDSNADVNGDGQVNVSDLNSVIAIILNMGDNPPVGEHEWVDLGLTSGTLWATMNVGAATPEDYGDYFAWGETSPKEVYDWTTYKWCDGSPTVLTKYCTLSEIGTIDDKIMLEPEDDAATVNWGTSWSIPSHDQQRELVDECTWTWTTRNGVDGQLVTGPNGNTIFLPAAGLHKGDALNSAEVWGYYWSSEVFAGGDYRSYAIRFNSEGGHSGINPLFMRSNGFTVRPVRIPQE